MNFLHINIKERATVKISFLILLFVCCIQTKGNNCYLTDDNNPEFNLQTISFVQNSINVTHSDVSFFFSLKAYSQLGLNKAVIFFISPSGNKVLETSCCNKKKSKIGLLLGRVLFKKKSEPGEWKIQKIIIEDFEGHKVTYDQSYLINNKLVYSLWVEKK